MAVDETIVARVAHLARLKLAAGEAGALAGELNNIFGWIDQLQAVDTDGIEPMNSVMAITRPWREDIVNDGDVAEAVLANAPDAAHGFFSVPKVIE